MSQTTSEYRVEVQTPGDYRWVTLVWPSTKEDAEAAMEKLVSEEHKRVRVIETRTTVSHLVVGFAAYMGKTDEEVVQAVIEGRHL